MGDYGLARGEGFDWEETEDLTSLSEVELRAHLGALAEEELASSYRLRILQGRMDVIRAELVRRGAVTLQPGDLARALLGEVGEAGRPS
jgi:hypothetical protein